MVHGVHGEWRGTPTFGTWCRDFGWTLEDVHHIKLIIWFLSIIHATVDVDTFIPDLGNYEGVPELRDP